MITKETRTESLNELDKIKRYEEIRYVLKNEINGLTARELAKKLGSDERNYTAPRCTELVQMGKLEVIGKRYDPITKRNVAVYALPKPKQCTCIENCKNCKHSYIDFTVKDKVSEVFCRKWNQNVDKTKAKQMKFCFYFEKREVI